MKPQGAFIAAGLAANHCPELLSGTLAQPNTQAALEARTARLSRFLPGYLAPCCGGIAPQVRIGELENMDSAALGERIGELAGNCILKPVGGSDAGTAPLLLSITAPTIFVLLDRAFGGPGKLPKTLPETFPASAMPVLGRLQDALAAGLTDALQLPQALRCGPRNSDYSALEAFSSDTALTVMTINFVIPDVLPCEVLLAFPNTALDSLLSGSDSSRKSGARQGPASPYDEPFADMPLCLEARLVDMRIPLRQLAELTKDMVLPVAVNRKVPVTLGKITIAEGSVGAREDRVALKITRSLIHPDTQDQAAEPAGMGGGNAAGSPENFTSPQDNLA